MASEIKERNALAELAERMKLDVDELNGKHRDHLGIYQCVTDDVCKAQRIIAELAKVKFGDDGMHENDFDADVVLSNCRAIAEEVAK